MFFAVIVLAMVKLYQAGCYKELVMLSVFSLYAIMEQFVLNGFMNPFILLVGILLYPNLLNQIKEGKKEEKHGKISYSSNS